MVKIFASPIFFGIKKKNHDQSEGGKLVKKAFWIVKFFGNIVDPQTKLMPKEILVPNNLLGQEKFESKKDEKKFGSEYNLDLKNWF